MSPHGTLVRYVQGCRCDNCRSASAAYMRDNRATRIARGERMVHGMFVTGPRINRRPGDPPPHGTTNRFNWRFGKCTCDLCREAWNTYRRELRLRRTAEQATG